MTKTDVIILLNILTILTGLYLAFVKSYFQEKGKNVATKEDIEEITEKIEKVKSDVGILTHKKISLSTEKQNALLDFNGKYTAWLNYILDVSIISNTDPAMLHVEKVKEKLDQLFYDLAISEAKIDVFFYSDHELINLKNEIKLKTIELSNHLNINLVRASTAREQILNVNLLPTEVPDNSYKINQLNKYYGEQDEIHEAFQEKKLTMYRAFSPSIYKLAEIISTRVYDIDMK